MELASLVLLLIRPREDEYPPFTLGRTDYPATFDVAYPDQLSRGLVLIKSWLLAIPHLLIVGVLTGSTAWGLGWMSDSESTTAGWSLLGLLVLIAGAFLLFIGRYPQALFDLIMGVNRWAFRVAAYVALMRDENPPVPFRSGCSRNYPPARATRWARELRGLTIASPAS